ncbi:MAG: exodeoxyribonuclease VII large subunit [Alphaproteobacteria bacterium]|nr:exodeoxyribonuclease VII large subunit [Alphaproteobacteria bacterium]
MTEPRGNLPEYSVSELSQAVKRTVEDNFEIVRVRGEISGFKRHTSGHLYFSLKDADAAIDGVCWRGAAGKLGIKPEDGMEVVATGRLTTYPGRSKYQIVVERMELAGQGALLKLIEDRKKRLAAEGLFDASRKRKLPYLPDTIGVVTSATGAVIRDILHRLADRFPRRVLVWAVAVQGEGAAEQVAAAIRGFNALVPGGAVPRPDVLIVARGGGSLEDLMAFNDEIVVRAAAESEIPLVSAVGHETDTTLIDFAADVRAPTPTAAAEMVVPVRQELAARIARAGATLEASLARTLDERRTRIAAAARALGDPKRMVEERAQRLDERGERLKLAILAALDARKRRTIELGARLPDPKTQLERARGQLLRLSAALASNAGARRTALAREAKHLDDLLTRAKSAGIRVMETRGQRIAALGELLESYSHKKVLERGFAMVVDADGRPVQKAGEAEPGAHVTLTFADGTAGATIDGEAAAKPEKKAKAAKAAPAGQGSLL